MHALCSAPTPGPWNAITVCTAGREAPTLMVTSDSHVTEAQESFPASHQEVCRPAPSPISAQVASPHRLLSPVTSFHHSTTASTRHTWSQSQYHSPEVSLITHFRKGSASSFFITYSVCFLHGLLIIIDNVSLLNL